jgi:hypothetical protein
LQLWFAKISIRPNALCFLEFASSAFEQEALVDLNLLTVNNGYTAHGSNFCGAQPF